jgi:hypothetical protein
VRLPSASLLCPDCRILCDLTNFIQRPIPSKCLVNTLRHWSPGTAAQGTLCRKATAKSDHRMGSGRTSLGRIPDMY